MSIRSAQHEIRTIGVIKIALDCFDSKRFLFNGNIATVPFKPYLTLEDVFVNQIFLEDELERRSQSSNKFLPDVDIIREVIFVVPDQGYRQWKNSHKELNPNLAVRSQTVEKR